MKIYTARYWNKNIASLDAVPIQTSNGRPKFRLPYDLFYTLPELMPDRQTINMESEAEFRNLYHEKLDRSGPRAIEQWLQDIAKRAGKTDVVLLCFEDIRQPGQWCHRTAFADWYQETYGELVEELPE